MNGERYYSAKNQIHHPYYIFLTEKVAGFCNFFLGLVSVRCKYLM